MKIPGRILLPREMPRAATLARAENSSLGARIASLRPCGDGAGRMTKFFRKTDGVVTIEWVAIAAVMVLAAIGVTAYTMQAVDGAGSKVSAGIRSVDASTPLPGGAFGDGLMN
jgi:hypothetical protein